MTPWKAIESLESSCKALLAVCEDQERRITAIENYLDSLKMVKLQPAAKEKAHLLMQGSLVQVAAIVLWGIFARRSCALWGCEITQMPRL